MHGTAHGRVEQGAEDATVNGPDGVIQVLADLKPEPLLEALMGPWLSR